MGPPILILFIYLLFLLHMYTKADLMLFTLSQPRVNLHLSLVGYAYLLHHNKTRQA